jgi:XTP/dITP diphosphohydrolase
MTIPKTLLIATGNPHKVEEIAAVFTEVSGVDVQLMNLADLPDAPAEPEEDGETFEDNARLKAAYYAQKTGHWCLADDSGLEVDALEGEPGVRSARYAGVDGNRSDRDAANNTKLLEAMQDVPDRRRSARFVCAMCLANVEGEIVRETEGTLEGSIGFSPVGAGGFGYDPLLLLEDGRTVAQLTPDEKNAHSHRGEATREMAAWLAGQGG